MSDTYCVTYLHHTAKALLVESGGEEIWLPLSQVKVEDVDLDDCTRGEDIDIEVPDWLALDKGLS